jgi:hypothetical protein
VENLFHHALQVASEKQRPIYKLPSWEAGSLRWYVVKLAALDCIE